MTSPSDWASLQGQLACATSLYGDAGAARVAEWFAQEEERIDDPSFARLFSDHINLPGIVSLDYTHRHVAARTGSLIGGIRFYGQDITRPFVEVIAHDFDDMTELAQVVSSEWRTFAPQRLRLLAMPGASLPATADLDMSVYAARYDRLSPPPQEVQLGVFDYPDQAMTLIQNRYDVMIAIGSRLAASRTSPSVCLRSVDGKDCIGSLLSSKIDKSDIIASGHTGMHFRISRLWLIAPLSDRL